MCTCNPCCLSTYLLVLALQSLSTALPTHADTSLNSAFNLFSHPNISLPPGLLLNYRFYCLTRYMTFVPSHDVSNPVHTFLCSLSLTATTPMTFLITHLWSRHIIPIPLQQLRLHAFCPSWPLANILAAGLKKAFLSDTKVKDSIKWIKKILTVIRDYSFDVFTRTCWIWYNTNNPKCALQTGIVKWCWKLCWLNKLINS